VKKYINNSANVIAGITIIASVVFVIAAGIYLINEGTTEVTVEQYKILSPCVREKVRTFSNAGLVVSNGDVRLFTVTCNRVQYPN
jgi:hypothetical protein